MKVLYMENAKATWLFDLRVINPHGISIRHLLSGVAERYRFAKVPNNPLDVKDGGVSFVEGIFRTSSEIDVGVSLTAYADGLVADSFSNTNYTTEFLRDLAQFAEELGYKFPTESEIGKSYTSTLGVSCELSLPKFTPTLNEIALFLEQNTITMDGKPRRYEFGGIEIYTEDAGQNKAPSPFKFERKWGVPWTTNRYISQAPLETDKHVALLERLEEILGT